MKALHEIRRDVVRVCRRLDEREYVGGRDGNVSVRLSETTILVTPAGLRKGDIEAQDLLLVNRRGDRIDGKGKPSTETGMHLRIYDRRPDVRAVVHAHPPVATGFAATGRGITGCFLPEVIVGLGQVPVVPYALPGTTEVADAIERELAGHDAFLLENHGAVTVGGDVDSAYQRMETVEQAARILLAARLLGGANPLPAEEVQRLVDSRRRYGIREGLAACSPGGEGPAPRAAERRGDPYEEEALVEEIAARVLRAVRDAVPGEAS